MLKLNLSLTLKTLCAAALLTIAGPALAAQGAVVAKVNQVLMTGDTRWGGCMALLSVSPHTKLAGCGAGWVTFSCTGDFTDMVRAYRMADQAQLAMASGKNVAIWFQDDKKHNGFCFANRIDVAR